MLEVSATAYPVMPVVDGLLRLFIDVYWLQLIQGGGPLAALP